MSRRFFAFLSLLSFVLSVATMAMWVRSARTDDRLGLSTSHGRYTLHSDKDRLFLTGPPLASSPAAEAKAADIVARLNNSSIAWSVVWQTRDGGRDLVSIGCGLSERPFQEIMSVPPATLQRSLLRALDDPDRFVAAHFALIQMRRGSWFARYQVNGDGSIANEQEWLRLTLLPGSWDYQPLDWENSRYWRTCADPRFWRVEPGQQGAIRDLWHDQFDVRLRSCPHWIVAAGFLLVPAAWVGARIRRANRRRRNLCPGCGYNLTGNASGVCPECGNNSIRANA